VKVTVPVGAALALAGFTVAVKTVLAEEVMLVGLAATVVVVLIGAAVTAIVTEPLEFAKLPVAT
jgi:type IV secretory pathway TrbD component